MGLCEGDFGVRRGKGEIAFLRLDGVPLHVIARHQAVEVAEGAMPLETEEPQAGQEQASVKDG